MVELNRSDLIPRPDNLPEVTEAVTEAPGGFSLRSIIDRIREFQELVGILRQISGGKLDELLPQLRSIASEGEGAAPAAPGQGVQQVVAFVQLLQAQYGDITINELIDRLKADIGDKRLSQFTKGGL